MSGFILACSECGNRITIDQNNKDISEKFNVAVSDTKEIFIICNEEGCNNKIKI